MKRIFTILALVVISQMSTVQTVFSQKLDTSGLFTYPLLSKNERKLDDFAPKNWEVTDTISGDLNKDGIDDAVLILRYQDSIEINEGFRYPRILVIAFKIGDHYELKLQHNTLIEFERLAGSGNTGDFDGDTFDGIRIEKGVLILNFKWDIRGAGSLLRYVVRYQSNDFYLIGATSTSGYHASESTYDVNYSTGRYTYDATDDERGFGGTYSELHKKGKLPGNALKKLNEIKEPGNWNLPGMNF